MINKCADQIIDRDQIDDLDDLWSSQAKNTDSCQVKQCWTCLILRWVTTLYGQVP